MARLLAFLALLAAATLSTEPDRAWSAGGGGWRTDPAWHDGKAEVAVYRATRVIYGKPREYQATAYTNKERYDRRTTTKSADDRGLEVFKHHWSEIVPTESYDYRFSTSLYTACDSLEAVKLTASTQEGCGASFKQAWRDGERIRWLDSVYFPGAGNRDGDLAGAREIHFVDELTLLLRDFPFESGGERELRLVRSQKSNLQVSFETFDAKVRYAGREVLELPIGPTDAHHLVLEGSGARADYWFAADGSAPRLHVLVRYEDPSGARYELSSLVRSAYWER